MTEVHERGRDRFHVAGTFVLDLGAPLGDALLKQIGLRLIQNQETLIRMARDLVVRDTSADEFIEQAAAFARAVSYTHLRAHETVLDLVCRLLLEKKKLA